MDDNSAPETEAAPSDLFLDRLLDATLELAPDMGWTRARRKRRLRGCFAATCIGSIWDRQARTFLLQAPRSRDH